jgi:hypothetical protein
LPKSPLRLPPARCPLLRPFCPPLGKKRLFAAYYLKYTKKAAQWQSAIAGLAFAGRVPLAGKLPQRKWILRKSAAIND